MTKPREWPNRARWARDDTATLLQEIITVTRPMLNHPDSNVAACAGRVLDKAQRGIRYLVEVGASIHEDTLP